MNNINKTFENNSGKIKEKLKREKLKEKLNRK
jgi:hypothetical protein